MNRRLIVLLTVLIAFTAFSTGVTLEHGYWGFLSLALSDAWGAQIFLDLVIAVTLFSMWMKRDSREQGIAFWPYLVGLVFLGSISALTYLVHREWKLGRAAVTAAAA